ncbi:hypothetical protein AKO1_009577 [Acrasis kona]|uniref:t-SNARE coiled-coil homology domain-containing protein n=1 Tax=Acrasis kona TaxID=1008807 RepID=A0AAW2ZP67_9EUKA
MSFRDAFSKDKQTSASSDSEQKRLTDEVSEYLRLAYGLLNQVDGLRRELLNNRMSELKNQIKRRNDKLSDYVREISSRLKKLDALLLTINDEQMEALVDKLKSEFRRFTNRMKSVQTEVSLQMSTPITPSSPRIDDDVNTKQMLLKKQKDDAVTSEIETNNKIIMERNKDFEQIEVDVKDINGIMTELGSLINKQKDKLDLIEVNTVESQVLVKTANVELEQSDTWHKKLSISSLFGWL